MGLKAALAVVSLMSLSGTFASFAGDVDYSSGNFMLPHCKHFLADNYRYDVWDGDCGGVISTLLFFDAVLPEGVRFCSPSGVSQNQAASVVVQYLDAHPEKRHLNFRGLAVTALHDAWPCKRAKP
jgi:hypothetical protein